MKTNWGVGLQLHVPATLPLPIGEDAGWPRKSVRTPYASPYKKSNPGRPSRSLVTILTELPRLTSLHIFSICKKEANEFKSHVVGSNRIKIMKCTLCVGRGF